jgi:hypothetical protein
MLIGTLDSTPITHWQHSIANVACPMPVQILHECQLTKYIVYKMGPFAYPKFILMHIHINGYYINYLCSR